MKKNQWYLFSYKAPSTPSTLRVRIWRTLKTLGVLYLQQSVCIVPKDQDVEKRLKKLEILIREHNGESNLLEVEKLSAKSEEALILDFNSERDKEYKEFIEESEQFLKELETESARQKFTFHEVEENEAELQRLKKWFRKIKKRDFFSSNLGARCEEMLRLCEKEFDDFTEKVYLSEGVIEGEIVKE